jgi:2-amino-4-hydroxy-6-hydroxymethyldihydropteridine diphosphokinase
MKELYLSLGSNIEPKDEKLKIALKALVEYFAFVKVSSVYLTEPLLDTEQDSFLNIVALYKTEINDPEEILKITKGIEKKLGRIKDIKRPKGPRLIDIDILLFGEDEYVSDELTLPHKGLFFRKFALKPLIEILPKESIYYKKYKLKKHLKEVNGQKIKKIGVLNFER